MSFKQLIVSLSLILLSTTTFANSDENTERDIYSDCVEEHGTINNGVVDACSNRASDSLKAEMNKLYSIIYKKIAERSVEDAKSFEKSQMAWLKYRQTHCDLMGSYVGSPMHAFCPMELNRIRVLELRELAN